MMEYLTCVNSLCLHPNLAPTDEIGKNCQSLESAGFPSQGWSDRRYVGGQTVRVRVRVCFRQVSGFLAREGMFRVSFGFYPELDVEKGLFKGQDRFIVKPPNTIYLNRSFTIFSILP